MIDVLCNKYRSKAKRPKLDSGNGDLNVPDSVLAMLSTPQGLGEPSSSTAGSSQPLDARVVGSISAELAAALIQAQNRIYEEDDEDYDEISGSELNFESIMPNTSGIRDEDALTNEAGYSGRTEAMVSKQDGEDDFPIPLRKRKEKESVGIAGLKRKR